MLPGASLQFPEIMHQLQKFEPLNYQQTALDKTIKSA